MPLPDKVIEQLGKDSPATPGWALGAMFFGGGILFLTILIYCGLTFGYEPYINNQLTAITSKVNLLGNSISPAQQTQLINFYSQIENLQTLLQSHVISSQFFTWLEQNTEANVYYSSFSLQSGDAVNLTANAATEGDVNQQIAIFENSPEVSSVAVSNVNPPSQAGNDWTFTIVLSMNPSLFLPSTQ